VEAGLREGEFLQPFLQFEEEVDDAGFDVGSGSPETLGVEELFAWVILWVLLELWDGGLFEGGIVAVVGVVSMFGGQVQEGAYLLVVHNCYYLNMAILLLSQQ
jgi:hypothetical protein